MIPPATQLYPYSMEIKNQFPSNCEMSSADYGGSFVIFYHTYSYYSRKNELSFCYWIFFGFSGKYKYINVMKMVFYMGISFIRTILLYLIIVCALRIMGKRQIGELQPSELVVTILISELAAIPMQETGIPIVNGVIPILTLVACEILISIFSLKSLHLRNFISGKPSILIRDGVIMQKELRKMRMSIDDLMEELRISGFFNVDEVAFAILETNGKLSVVPRPENKPATAGMLNLPLEDTGLPLPAISDGNILEANLAFNGKDKAWLDGELKKHAKTSKQIFLFIIDKNGKAVIIPRDEK